MEVQFIIKNEPVLLRADDFNYELCRIKRRTDKDSGDTYESWEPFRFFASLEQALNRVIDMKVRASDAKSLSELKQAILDARDEVCRKWDTRMDA